MPSRVWLAFGAALVAAACDPDAVGVEQCRRIEHARCEASRPCRSADFDVDECKRFYSDHCLHGVALEEAPAEPAVDDCVDAVRALGRCATSSPDTPIASCEDPQVGAAGLTACQALDEPHLISGCAFLVPNQEPPGAGGASGTGGAGSGGTAGSAGAAD